MSPSDNDVVEVLPCPFCGSSEAFLTDAGPDYWIECRSCGTQGPYANGSETDEATNALAISDARRLWNTRTLSAEAGKRELVEALLQIELQSTNIAGDFDTEPWKFAQDLGQIAREALAKHRGEQS